MKKFLPDFGYGMPKNIPLADVQDTKKSRQLADQFITGYSDYHNFETPLEKLVAYNAGPNFAANGKQQGRTSLTCQLRHSVQKAAAFLTRKGKDDMAYLGMPSEMTTDHRGDVISPKWKTAAAKKQADGSYSPSHEAPHDENITIPKDHDGVSTTTATIAANLMLTWA